VAIGASYMKKNPNGTTEPLKLKSPIDIVPWGADTRYYKKTDQIPKTVNDTLSGIKEEFAFLFVGQWTAGNMNADRKAIGWLIKTFLETFRDVPNAPALVLKTSGAQLCIMDKYDCLNKINDVTAMVKNAHPNAKLPNVYLLHGELSDVEMNALYNHPKIKAHVSFTHGEGFCGLDYTPIITENGIKRIDSIRKGDRVLSREFDGDMYKIIPFNSQNKEPIVLTGNHNVYVFDDITNTFKWIPAQDLTPNHILCIPKHKYDIKHSKICLSNYISNNNIIVNNGRIEFKHSNKKYTPIPNELLLTKEMGKIIGYFLAEGHFCKSNGDISFSLNQDEENTICEELITCFDKVFELKVYRKSNIKNTKTLSLKFNSKIVGLFLAGFCGERAKTKYINDFIFNSTEEFKSNIISSLILGDGHIKEQNYNSTMEISLVNDKILRSIKLLLLEKEIISNFDHFTRKGIIKDTWKYESNVERLRVSQIESLNKLFCIINDNHEFSNIPIHSSNNISKGIPQTQVVEHHILINIKNIEKVCFTGKVYNISVQEDESYCTENFMVHNCHPMLLASLSGKPVITPKWSGHLDFLNPKYASFFEGNLVPIPGEAINDWFIKESQWFDVDYASAGRLMKNMFYNYDDKLLDKYEKLRLENMEKFSLQAMDAVLHPLLDKHVPKFIMEEPIKLPKLKRLSMPVASPSPAPTATEVTTSLTKGT
jgi:intein/homing endonuclease